MGNIASQWATLELFGDRKARFGVVAEEALLAKRREGGSALRLLTPSDDGLTAEAIAALDCCASSILKTDLLPRVLHPLKTHWIDASAEEPRGGSAKVPVIDSRIWVVFQDGHSSDPMTDQTLVDFFTATHPRRDVGESSTFAPVCLMELHRHTVEQDLAHTLKTLRSALAHALEPLRTHFFSVGKFGVTGAAASEAHAQEGPVELRRDELLKLGWPTSKELSELAGSKSANRAQWAKDRRDAGQLLGVWSPAERTYRHPDFQFDEFGRPSPAVFELLSVLKKKPQFSPADDPSGWRRAFWLYQPRRDLSRAVLAVAEADSLQGIEPEAAMALLREGLADRSADRIAPRSPAEVFRENPDAVIVVAQRDVVAAHDPAQADVPPL